MSPKVFITYSILLITFSSCKFRQKIPLLVHHAKIYTVDENFSIAEAMAIRDGKIIAIGTNDEILKELAFDRMIQRGLKDSSENKTISNQEMKNRIKQW